MFLFVLRQCVGFKLRTLLPLPPRYQGCGALSIGRQGVPSATFQSLSVTSLCGVACRSPLDKTPAPGWDPAGGSGRTTASSEKRTHGSHAGLLCPGRPACSNRQMLSALQGRAAGTVAQVGQGSGSRAFGLGGSAFPRCTESTSLSGNKGHRFIFGPAPFF